MFTSRKYTQNHGISPQEGKDTFRAAMPSTYGLLTTPILWKNKKYVSYKLLCYFQRSLCSLPSMLGSLSNSAQHANQRAVYRRHTLTSSPKDSPCPQHNYMVHIIEVLLTSSSFCKGYQISGTA